MAFAVRRWRAGNRDPISREQIITTAAIASMPVLMPYYMDYDLLLLAIPAVLLSAEWIRHPGEITRADHWLLAAWAVFCVETHFNPGISGNSHWNPAVPLLVVISILHIAHVPARPGGTGGPPSACSRCGRFHRFSLN